MLNLAICNIKNWSIGVVGASLLYPESNALHDVGQQSDISDNDLPVVTTCTYAQAPASSSLGNAQLHLLVLLYSGWELVKREAVAMDTVV
ncbi:MAG: hypothetical protein QG599_258 [Pseudomonadota bacterium]|nr:hypothetical protein [Pseudomonadota bacterium]